MDFYVLFFFASCFFCVSWLPQLVVDCSSTRSSREEFFAKKIFNKLDGLIGVTHVETTSLPKSNLNIFNEFSHMNNNNIDHINSAESTSSTDSIKAPLSQIVVFNIGDSNVADATAKKSFFRQNFDQDSINYCHFDPLLLNDKRTQTEAVTSGRPSDFNLNVYFNGDFFNETSQLTGGLN